jgi:biotin carboxylase
MGIDVTVITDNVTPAVEQNAKLAVKAYPRDIATVLDALRDVEVGGVDGVMSLGYENPPVIAALAARFGVRSVPMETALDCTHKHRRIAKLAEAGIPVADFRIATSMSEALDAVESLGLPVVVKPADLTSSLGVSKILSFEDARVQIEHALSLSKQEIVVVERYISGTEHTVEGILTDEEFFTGFSDRNYSEKDRFAPYFFEDGDTLPSRLAMDDREEIIAVAVRAARSLGVRDAVISCDMLLSADGLPFVLEVACRMAGSRFGTEIVSLSNGINILPSAVRLALVWPLDRAELEWKSDNPVVLRYLPCEGGRVVEVGQIDLNALHSSTYDAFWEMDLVPDLDLPVYTSGKDVIAGVICTGNSIEEAEAVAQAELANLPLKIEQRNSGDVLQ